MLNKITKVGILLAVVVVLMPYGSFKKESPPPRPIPLEETTEVTWPRVKVTELVLKKGMSMDDIHESVDELEQLEQ